METSLGTSFKAAIFERSFAVSGVGMLESACRANFCFAQDDPMVSVEESFSAPHYFPRG